LEEERAIVLYLSCFFLPAGFSKPCMTKSVTEAGLRIILKKKNSHSLYLY